MERYRRGKHAVFSLHVHLVFVTKHRRNVLTDRVHKMLRECFTQVCAASNCTLVEADGAGDHVHLLLEYPPTVQLSKLVNTLKGYSSREVRKKNYPEVLEKLWGSSLWSPSYFAVSCGGAPIEIVKRYIEGQRA